VHVPPLLLLLLPPPLPLPLAEPASGLLPGGDGDEHWTRARSEAGAAKHTRITIARDGNDDKILYFDVNIFFLLSVPLSSSAPSASKGRDGSDPPFPRYIPSCFRDNQWPTEKKRF
jgi:hypothetical protein